MENYSLPTGFQLRDKYCIQKVLGQGGFGITYLAEDMVLDIDVCIKELFISGNSTRSSNHSVMSSGGKDFSFDDFKQRFIQEARQLAKFRHPNIVRVLDFFEANSTVYVVMEFISGKTLKEFTAERGFVTQGLAIPIIDQLLDAVEEVHQLGMLHRDIKPDNILLTDKNSVVLIDFGSAREFSEGLTMTQTAMLTPGYAPMEQYSNRAKRGTFTDIYALGATMYFMLTGEKPLAATDRFAEEMAAPHQLNAEINSRISSAVMLAMQMKVEDRFQNIADFRKALELLSTMENKSEQKHTPAAETIIHPTQKNLATFTDEFGIEFILVEAGTFMMGANEDDKEAFDNEKPAHKVTLTKDFYIGKYPVTQAQWQKLIGNNPSYFKNNPSCPVESVSWYDCQGFIKKLNSISLKKYRLPTEAEWEFAARARMRTKGYLYAGSNIIDEVAWYQKKSFLGLISSGEGKTSIVGLKNANALGIFDMSGNVWEWCSDYFGMYNLSEELNPKGIITGKNRTARGGSWYSQSMLCRVSFRYSVYPGIKDNRTGFRLVLEIE
jgi:formylglycine-generating enzyme required for sulfatase activity/predicted Ser/Thr protein kinase